MDWVHCNNCFIQPGEQEGKKFFITNCGHIYCFECISLPELKVCRICKTSYNKLPLSSKMNKEIEPYFCDPLEDIQKQMKILEFQQGHRMRFTKFNRERIVKYNSLKKENIVLKEELKRCESEKTRLREEIQRITSELSHCQQKLEYLSNRNRPCNGDKSSKFDFLGNDGIKSPRFTPQLIQKPNGIVDSTENLHTILKRPPDANNFFIMSSKYSTPKNDNFMTPKVQNTSASYRSSLSNSGNRDYLESDVFHRKVKLPGDRGKQTSSAVRAAFHRLTLSKLTSTPKKDDFTSKYSQYFKK